MSVPAHAPYDWIALVESKTEIPAIKIIDVKDFKDNPAKEACEKLGIKSQTEKEKLDEATELVYKKEFHTGILNDKCGEYAGIRISDIKDTVKNDLISKNLALTMREFSEEVICRCREKVRIKQIPDQWFIKYSDYVLTQDSKDYAETMNIYPVDYKIEMPKILDWFDDRAAIRSGSWLGTEFPFKKGWIIEPISDSTLYPAYYIISKFVNNGRIAETELNNEFFNYVFLGLGTAKNKIWEEIKSDFDYWYPVDINLGGKEHKTVHFPVYLMNHVAIMPQHKCPRGLFVHWWVTQKGKEKISKSKGGAEPILEAATIYGVDAMRLYYAHVGSPFVDVEWDPEIVTKYKNRIQNIWNQIHQLINTKNDENKSLDAWLLSTLNRRIKSIQESFESYDIRVAANEIFFECQKDLLWYTKRGGANKKLIKRYITTWLKLMAPVTPHVAEEIWENLSNKPFISVEKYPSYNEKEISEKDEMGEFLVSKVIDDINEILKVTKITPKKICIYTSAKWKEEMFKKALKLDSENKFNVGTLIKDMMIDVKMNPLGKEISQLAGKLAGEIKMMNDNDKKRYQVEINEKEYLDSSKKYISGQFSSKIEVFCADDNNIYDPANKRKFAVPLRPAIFIE